MRPPIQCRHFEKEFRGLLQELSRAQGRAKEGLAAKEGRCGQAAAMVARRLLPAAAALAPDRP